jgi:hypothetical protein
MLEGASGLPVVAASVLAKVPAEAGSCTSGGPRTANETRAMNSLPIQRPMSALRVRRLAEAPVQQIPQSTATLRHQRRLGNSACAIPEASSGAASVPAPKAVDARVQGSDDHKE